MARPRVFISSTFYDLKHVRASLDLFVRSLGFDSVLSEKGDIAYSFDRPLDESCYTEVATADVFVLIVGGRYGAAASDQDTDATQTFFDRYESITKREYERAVELDVPIYVLVEKAVHAEYQTFRANRDNADVRYAHVDSVNVFELIDDILSRPRNNPVHTFERFTEVEEWLRDQWAGLFRDLLKRTGQQAQLRALSEQVAEMRELNETLKAYMETIVANVAPNESVQLIDSESKRRASRRLVRAANENPAVHFLSRGVLGDAVVRIIEEASSSADLVKRLRALYQAHALDTEVADEVEVWLQRGGSPFLEDMNEVRDLLGRPPFKLIRPSSAKSRT